MDSPSAPGAGPNGSQARPEFERIALLLQGGGALGAYQAGVYQALSEADLHPDCVAGISIGAINSALIAGNPPQRRVERLRAFWETVSQPPLGIPYLGAIDIKNDLAHQMVNQWRALGALLWGAPSFFQPRVPPPIFTPASDPSRLAFYDTSPLKALLESLVDFDRINAKETRFGVGAVNIKTGSRYLRDLLVLFRGNIELALAAYNAGEGAVIKAGNRVPNYRETQNYVKTVMQLYEMLKPPAFMRGAGRIHMEIPVGGAAGRGNLPPPEARLPEMPNAKVAKDSQSTQSLL